MRGASRAAEATAPETALVTGQGGAGRTTVAAALACAAASGGRRTLLLSGDGPDTLAAVLGVRPGTDGGTGEPAEVPGACGLRLLRVDSGARFRAAVLALQKRAGAALGVLGADPLDEDELTALPGAEAFALLHALRTEHASGAWDTLVVDLPAAPHALALLALPEQLGRHLGRLAPREGQAAHALRPLLAQLAGMPVPTRDLHETVAEWQSHLAGVQRVLEAPGTSVRLVADPGPVGAEALRAARAGVGLYGLRLGGTVANRVLPTGSTDTWLATLSGRQQAVLKEWREEYGTRGQPLTQLPHLGRDPRGVADLAALAAHCTGHGTAHRTEAGSGTGALPRVEDRLAENGLLVWRLPLPAVRKAELDLVRRGDELILTVGPHRRILPLHPALRRCRIAGAALDAGELRVRFTPDPDLWPAPRVR